MCHTCALAQGRNSGHHDRRGESKKGIYRLFLLYFHGFSYGERKVEISLYSNLITIKLFKLIDRFIPFWWEEELCLLLSEFRDDRSLR